MSNVLTTEDSNHYMFSSTVLIKMLSVESLSFFRRKLFIIVW